MSWDSTATVVQAQNETIAEVQDHTLQAAGDDLLADEQLTAALEKYTQAYLQYRQQNNKPSQIAVLYKIGQIHYVRSEFPSAIAVYQQALEISNAIDDPTIQRQRANILYFLGLIFFELTQPEQAVSFLNQVIELSAAADIELGTLGLSFYTLGVIAENQSRFSDAIAAYAQARSIFGRAFAMSGDEIFVEDQLKAVIATGNIWLRLGDFETAKQFYHQAIALNRDVKSDLRASQIFDNLGVLEIYQGNYPEALSFTQRALSIKETLSDISGIGQTLHNLGNIYIFQGEFRQALSVLDKALDTTPIQDTGTVINLTTALAISYANIADYTLAWDHYHRAIRLSLKGGERRRQIIAVVHLAQMMEQQEQPLLAIAFYKQAINEIEQVRENLRSLPLETQKRYTETVADSYRQLAALLLDQERVFEAQQVLDLLKIQELEDYLHDVREERPQAIEKLPLLPPERILLEQYQILLLEEQSETDPVLSLEEFLKSPVVTEALENLTHADSLQLRPDSLRQLQRKLKKLPHTSGVLYPLVLEESLELLFVPPEGTPIHKTSMLTKPQLTEQVGTLRYRLADPSSDVKPLAGSLYDAVVAPLQTELDQLNIENIIYVPDSVLHYIPLSVFYDRTQNQWLAERYTSHNITASDIGDLTQPPSRPFSVLAGAFADINQTFEKLIDQQPTSFYGLTYAGQEVSFLQKKLPETHVLLDTAFSRNNLEAQLNGQNIVHLATHAAFVPGQPEESFILLGDGDTLTLKELRNWSLPNVDLVVLSACQTGISHIEDGLEILGMGFQVQRTDARAALASLWWVDDRSTSYLMELFYTELAAGASKAQALQSAQRQLIASGQDEPYYWAPFVLIGNGL